MTSMSMSVDGMLGMVTSRPGVCLSMGLGVPELGGFPYNFLFNGPSPNRSVPYLHSFNHQILNVAIEETFTSCAREHLK